MTKLLERQAKGILIRNERKRQKLDLRSLIEISPGMISLSYLSEVERGKKEASSEVLGAVLDALLYPKAKFYRDIAQMMEE